MEREENTLSIKEVDMLINNIPKLPTEMDPKTVALLFKIMYHGMLWVTEVIELRAKDIDYRKKEINIRNTKGGRITTVTFSSNSVWQEIINYIKDLEPDQKLFDISRQSVWSWSKKLGELTQIKMTHMTKETDNLYNTVLRNSRKRHLQNSWIFRESEIDQLSRDTTALKERGFGEHPYSMDNLKKKEEEANKILLTYCELCDYKNPYVANFCCICGKSLSEGKSIIR